MRVCVRDLKDRVLGASRLNLGMVTLPEDSPGKSSGDRGLVGASIDLERTSELTLYPTRPTSLIFNFS